MGNRAGRRDANVPYGGGDPNLYEYGAGYGYGGEPGLAGYGGPYGNYGVAPGNNLITPPTSYREPWQETYWTNYYVPTVNGRQKRPVIYVAAPLPPAAAAAPAVNPCAGVGGFGGGFPMGSGFGGGLPMAGGFGASLPMAGGFGASLPMGSGFGGGFPMASGFGGGLPMAGGFGGSLPMGSGFGGGFPMASGFGGGLPLGSGFGAGSPCGGSYGANLGYQVLPMVTVAYGGGIPCVGGGLGGNLPLY